jgi:toxin ParE1/3/4
MPSPIVELRIAGPARRDIANILKLSQTEFGEAAARRYATLIVQALEDILADPNRPGSMELWT